MKNLWLTCGVSLLFMGCATQTKPDHSKTVAYVCPMDTTFTVKYSANGATATLFDSANRAFVLKHTKAASGTRYQDQHKDVSIHEKAGHLLVELVQGTYIECTEFKRTQ